MAQIAFREVFKHFGMPTVLISDRDPRFTAKFWQTFFRLSGTKLNMSSSHHPQTDGQTERQHRTMEEMLRHFVHDKQDLWETYLPAVMFAYNTAKQASTGQSPFFLNFHRHPRTPAAFLAELTQEQVTRDSTSPAAVSFIETARDAITKARAALQRAQQRQAEYADRTRTERTFAVGDWVLLSREHFRRRSPDGSKKLEPLYTGPIKIEKLISKVAVQLALPPQLGRMHPVVHVSMIEPYRDGEAEFPGRQKPVMVQSPVAPGNESRFTVERFLAARKVDGRVQYYIKWQGFPDSENSWEPSYALQQDLGRKNYLEFIRQMKLQLQQQLELEDG